jgi:hypothetical protein|tara:strand:+ start:323 stop:2014 length:1692 start_codon:yes stop_codon:yes gene_type:complete
MNKLFKIQNDIPLLLLILIAIIISYFNLILHGGFGSGDDIDLVLNAKDNNLGDLIKSRFFGKHADRPVSMFLLELTHYFFQDNARLYIISSIITWLLAIIFLSLVLLQLLNKKTFYTFLLISPFPFFASSVFAGLSSMTQYFTSILFWSISLFFLVQYAGSKKIFTYFYGLFFLLLSLLSLEHIIPLLLLTIFFPIIYELEQINTVNKKLLIKFFLVYFLPIIIISIFYLIFKIYIVKFYSPSQTIYGVSEFNLKSFFQSIYYFFAIIVEVPLLLFESISYIFNYKRFFLILLIIIFFFFLINFDLNNNKIQKKSTIKKTYKLFLLVLFLSLFSSAINFFISAYPASTFGFYNKMMVPSFISFTIIVSILLSKIKRKRYFFIPILVSLFWIFSMFIQLDNIVKSWELRDEIVENIKIKIMESKINDNFILIANVPFFLKDNYNNARVFFTLWNFHAHLQLRNTNDLLITSWPISHRIITDPMFYPGHNILNNLDSISSDKDIYYYQFEENMEKSIFEFLGDKHDMLKRFELIKLKKINNHPIIFREKIRLKLIEFIKDKYNIR